MPEFSIITCTHNSESYLEANIKSVESQDFTDYEHIFIDGQSTDRTMDMIKQYREAHGEAVKIFSAEPRGISNAMNLGIRKASGNYLIHLHSDDSFYDRAVLSDAARFLREKPELDWIYGLANVVEKTGESILVYPNKPLLHFHTSRSFWGRYLMKFLSFVPHQSVFIRRGVFDRHGLFDESLPCMMDPDLWMRIRNNTKWSFYNRIICNYCVRSDAQSSSRHNKERNRKLMEQVQKRYMNRLEFAAARIINRIRYRRNKTNR